MAGPRWWQVNGDALQMGGNPKGSRIPARRDFDGIFPTVPICTPKMRKGSREVRREQGFGRDRVLLARGC